MDWYRSNASVPYAEDKVSGNEVQLNGGVRYLPRTDGRLNDLCERVFVTFSPAFDQDGKDLGTAAVSKIPSGWKISGWENARRYKVRIE